MSKYQFSEKQLSLIKILKLDIEQFPPSLYTEKYIKKCDLDKIIDTNKNNHLIYMLIYNKIHCFYKNENIFDDEITSYFQDKDYLLYIAIQMNSFESVKTILDNGAKASGQNKNCISPIIMAITQKEINIDIANYLIKYGAELPRTESPIKYPAKLDKRSSDRLTPASSKNNISSLSQ